VTPEGHAVVIKSNPDVLIFANFEPGAAGGRSPAIVVIASGVLGGWRLVPNLSSSLYYPLASQRPAAARIDRRQLP